MLSYTLKYRNTEKKIQKVKIQKLQGQKSEK